MASLDPPPVHYALRNGTLHLRRSRPLPVTVALITVVGLGAAAAGQFLLVLPTVQNRLRTTTVQALEESGFPDVTVSVHGRDIDLSGVPNDPAQIAKVTRIVRGVPGVYAVRTIVVPVTAPASASLPTATPSSPPSASVAAQPVSAAPAALEDLAAVGATVDAGEVVLFGSVPSQATRARLVSAVAAGFGADRVEDELSVDSDSGGYGLDGFAQVLLALGPQTRAGAVSLRTGRMTVTGAIPGEGVREAVRQAAQAALGADAAALTDTMTVSTGGAADDAQVAAQLSALPAITFATRSTRLTRASRPVIAAAAALLRAHPAVSVQVEGHTDASGIAESNLTLSQERADAVRKALREAGVPSDQLSAQGYGSTRPIAEGSGDLVDALNRRVVLVATAG